MKFRGETSCRLLSPTPKKSRLIYMSNSEHWKAKVEHVLKLKYNKISQQISAQL